MLADPDNDPTRPEPSSPTAGNDPTAGPPPQVSVVVATYNSGPGLDRVVRSLDRQTLAQSELEVVLIDDGSTDDTWARLEAVRDARTNVVIQQIPNSGWPSRPRNVGLDLARGEYVVFMDHDDEIFPDGLRAACAYAHAHDVDILSAKEVKTNSPTFGFDAYRNDSAGPRADLGIMSLVPMMPHKLYRRQMLLEHGVRFPEGRRVFWEDVCFNVDAYTAADRIGTMSSAPVYRRVIDKTNASKLYLPQKEEFWQKLMMVLDHVAAALKADEFATDLAELMLYQYRSRVLHNVAKLLAHGHEKVLPMVLPYVTDIQQKWVPAAAITGLPARYRVIDELLRDDDIDTLREVARATVRVIGTSATTSVGWDEGELVVRAEATWTAPPSALEPGFLAPQSDADVAAVTADLAAAQSVLVGFDRESMEPTALDTTQSVERAEVTDPLGALTLSTESRIAAPPHARTGVVDVQAHNSALGFTNQRGLRSKTKPRVGLVDGQAIVAYTNRQGLLSIDYGQSVRSVVNSAERKFGSATVTRGSAGLSLELPLAKVHVWGVTRIDGELMLTPEGSGRDDGDDAEVPDTAERFPAVLIGDASGARVEASAIARAGRYRLWFAFGGRPVPSEIVLTVPRLLGRPTLSARQAPLGRAVQRAVTATKQVTRSRPAP